MNLRGEQLRRIDWQQLHLDFSNPSIHIAVLAAHPDDETIGASVLLASFSRAFVFYLTDGAPRNAALWSTEFKDGSREKYAALRRVEAENAVARAGIPAKQIEWLGGVDQEAIVEVHRLVTKLAELVKRHKIAVLVTHPYEGGHHDHDTAALVAHLVTSLNVELRIVEMTSYHARGNTCETGEFLNSGYMPEISIELSTEDRIRKQAMLNAHASQRLVLENFTIEKERYRLAPQYDFSEAPHSGDLWYERMGWMTGSKWRSLAQEAAVTYAGAACR